MSPIKQLLTPPRTLSVKQALWDTILPAWGFFKSAQTLHALPPKTKKNGECPNRRSAFHKCAYLMTSGLCRLSHISSKLPLFTTIFFLCSEPTQCIVSMLYRDKFSLPVGQKNLYPRARRLYHNTTC